jgi:uncharacterized protein (TIGR02231 family)
MRPLVALALAASLAAPSATPAAELAARSRIDAVTIYRAGARVERVARLDLVAGDARVLLAGLPAELDDDSVRVEGKGTARARVMGVEVATVTGAEAQAEEARRAEDRLEALTAEDRGLEDAIAAARARQKFVESLRSTYSDERAKNLAVRPVSAKEWADLAGFVEGELAGAQGRVRKAEAARAALAKRIQAARAELDRLQAKRNQTTKTVAVELSAERAGALELQVSYLVRSAWWQPVWDARLEPETGAIALELQGMVTQRTGEDWDGVKLAVSTAEPGRGLWVPELEPRWLQKAMPRPMPTAKRALPMAPEAAAPQSLGRAGAAADELRAEPEESKLEVAEAQVEMGLIAATFTAPRREQVDGSGRPRSVPLARYALKGAIVRTGAPRVDPSVYLNARAKNETGTPFLPGMVRVSVGDEFVGKASLEATPPGGELTLAFGVDGRIEVERRVLDRSHETAGLISKDEVWRYRTRTSVKNRYQKAVTVELLDLVPVSRDEAISVKVLDGTTGGASELPDRPGVRSWPLQLKPGEERVVELRYEVRYPRGFPISGLE